MSIVYLSFYRALSKKTGIPVKRLPRMVTRGRLMVLRQERCEKSPEWVEKLMTSILKKND